jgi:hypothetical protein
VRASVDDTQGANAGSIIENERTASIEPNAGFIDNERIVGKSFRGVAGLVGIEGGVVSGVFNLESSGVVVPDWRPRHDEYYHEA